MAEKTEKTEKAGKKEKTVKAPPKKEEFVEEALVRISATDIPGDMNLYSGLTRIKGVSWAFSNALCHVLGIDKAKKLSELSPQEIEKINAFLKNPSMPQWLLNRRNDRETGVSRHIIMAELDVTKEWDIRRMKKIKSYKGWRHAQGQPVRGQRTKSHFRSQGAVGVKKGKSKTEAKPAAAPAKGGKK